jgi:hypothetical protein
VGKQRRPGGGQCCKQLKDAQREQPPGRPTSWSRSRYRLPRLPARSAVRICRCLPFGRLSER